MSWAPLWEDGSFSAKSESSSAASILHLSAGLHKLWDGLHAVTWSQTDSLCKGQYETLEQPEEFPTAPVQTQILQLPKRSQDLSFAKFDFDKEDQV